MSKTVGKILAVAAIVVGVVAAIPTLGGSLILTAGAASLISAGIAAATFVNSAILASKAKGQLQARQASVVALQFGEVAREGLLGQGLTGGSLVDAFNWGGKDGTDWECRVIALVDHFCDGLPGFFVNDVYVPFTGDGPVAGYNGQLEVYWRSGSLNQTVPGVVLANGPGWTSADIGAGVAWVAVCYKADKADAKTPVWPGGRPGFTWLVRGKRCYQARKDSSIGGSGAHRWNDPSTWEWTDNLIDCRYNWVRGIYAGDRVDNPDMLLVGRGLTAIEAPPVNVFAPANLCDEIVPIDAGGSEKRYTVNGVVKADEAYIDVEEHFAAACGGVIIQPEGSVEIEPGQAKAPVFFFSDEDLLVGSTVEFSDTLPESDEAWVNTVSPRYVEPSLKFTDHAAPVRRLVSDIMVDGGPREQSLSLALVTSGTQAGRVGEIARRLGRLLARGKVTLGPAFAEIEEGDWGVWTSQRYLKGESVLFRVEAYALNEKWHNTLTLREISPLVYARDADKASTSVALQPGNMAPIGQPGAGAWAATPVSLTKGDASVPGIAITGATDNDYADLVRFEFLPAAGVQDVNVAGGWLESGVAGPDVRQHLITSVAPRTFYYLAVSYMVGRRPGPRRILGPVSTDPGAADWETVKGPNKPADNATNSGDPASPFGPGGTVGGALKRINESEVAIKAAQDQVKAIETVTIPAVNARIDAANKRIDDAGGQIGTALDAEIERAKREESAIRVITGQQQKDIAGNKSAIEGEVTIRARDDAAIVDKVDRAITEYKGLDTATNTRITQSVTALSDADAATGRRIDAVITDYQGLNTAANTRITNSITAQAGINQSFGEQISGITTDYKNRDTATNTRITQSVTALSDANAATGRRVDQIDTDYKSADTAITTRFSREITGVSDATGAVARDVSTLSSNVGGLTGEVREAKGLIAGADGRTSVYWEVVGTTPSGQTMVRLSKSDGSRPIFYVGADLFVAGNAIVDGTIFTKAIANNAITNSAASRGSSASLNQGSGGSVELTSINLNASGTGFVRIDFQTDFTYQESDGGGSQGCYLTVTRMRNGVAEAEILRQDVFGYQLLGFALDDPGSGLVSYLFRAVEKPGGVGAYSYDFSYGRLAAMEFKK